ncbi:MAG: hypothetical protein ACREQ9_09380 [Candidatus Binatia bacterium]
MGELNTGVRNAWIIARHLRGADRRVWVLPDRQGPGYPIGAGLLANSSIVVCLPDRIAKTLRAEPSAG